MKDLVPDFKTTRELAEKYGVDIEITFGKNFRAIVSDGKEGHYIKNGFDKNLIEEIRNVCVEIKQRRDEEMKNINERLNNLDPLTFPHNLFEKQ